MGRELQRPKMTWREPRNARLVSKECETLR